MSFNYDNPFHLQRKTTYCLLAAWREGVDDHRIAKIVTPLQIEAPLLCYAWADIAIPPINPAGFTLYVFSQEEMKTAIKEKPSLGTIIVERPFTDWLTNPVLLRYLKCTVLKQVMQEEEL